MQALSRVYRGLSGAVSVPVVEVRAQGRAGGINQKRWVSGARRVGFDGQGHLREGVRSGFCKTALYLMLVNMISREEGLRT